MIQSTTLCEGGPILSRLISGQWRLADWDLSPENRLSFINDCLSLGITTFDLADIYGDYQVERLFGEALALNPAIRDRIQLMTKCGIKLVSENRPEHKTKHYDTSPHHILSSVERSLRDLQTDRIDVLMLHRPDPLMNPDEIAEAFWALRNAGKVLHFGVSNFSPSQFDLLQSRLQFPLVSNQIECSVMNLNGLHDGTVDQLLQLRRRPMAWSPLGRGKIFYADDDKTSRVRSALESVGEEISAETIAQTALAWLFSHPSGMLPLLGTGKMERLSQAAEAVSMTLSRDQWFTIWSASMGHDVP